jgi:hypothetical protein
MVIDLSKDGHDPNEEFYKSLKNEDVKFGCIVENPDGTFTELKSIE